jgi:hypothetical protein
MAAAWKMAECDEPKTKLERRETKKKQRKKVGRLQWGT